MSDKASFSKALFEALKDDDDQHANFFLPNNAYSIIYLFPPERNHEFLGGVSEQEVQKLTRISELPKYACLPRPTMLNPWKENISDPEIDKVFRMLHDEGRILFRAAVVPGGSDLHLFIACGDQDRCPQKYRGVLMDIMFKTKTWVSDGKVYGGHTLGFNSRNPFFRKFLPEEEKNALAARAVHVFLRQSGRAFYDAKSMNKVCMQLASVFGDRKQWVNMIDITIAAADVALKTPTVDDEQASRALTKVGEALEQAGRFVDAAELYLEKAAWLDGRATWDEDRHVAFSHAGLAFRTANLFEASEKAYVAAMYWSLQAAESSAAWNLNSNDNTDLITNLMVLYSFMYEEPTEGISKTEIGHVMSIFASLLFKLKFLSEPGGYTDRIVFGLGPKVNKKLKGIAKSKTASLEILVKASNTNEPQEFRSVLKSCAPASCTFEPLRNEQVRQDDVKVRRKADKEAARDRSDKPRMELFASRCSNPSCPSGQNHFFDATELRNCPCRLVKYCTKTCQVGHWKDHKNVCTARKTKQTKN